MGASKKRKHRNVAKGEFIKQEEQSYDWNTSEPSLTPQYEVDRNTALPKTEDDLGVKVDSTHEEPPKKKQRTIFEIRVPTLDEVHQQKLNKTALDKNSKIKKKGAEPDIVLSDTLRESRLALINHHVFEVKVPTPIKDQQVTRAFMSNTYGGSSQATRPKISPAKVRLHGYDKFAYLHTRYHPHAPMYPGQSGLFYSTKSGNSWDGTHKVLTRDPKKALWWYDGEYEFIACPSLTIDEWKSQDIQVRAHWATQICRQNWGQHVRSRILTRRELGRPGSPGEVEAVRESKRWETIIPLDVMQAYDVGEEAFGVWILKCVGYDETFQRQLCDKFPQWVKPPPQQPKTKGTKKSNQKRKTKSNSSAKQVKREESHDGSASEWESDDGDFVEDDLM